MPQPLRVTRGDFWMQADFSIPAFAAMERPAGLYHALFSELSRYGLTLADMKLDVGSGNLGDAELQCYFFGYTTTLQIRLDRAELRCREVTRVRPEDLRGLLVDALGVLKGMVRDAGLRTYTVGRGLHGVVDGSTARDFVSRYTQQPPATLGPAAGSSAAFYFGAESPRLVSYVSVDLSAIVQEAVYLRTQASWDASKIEIASLPTVVDDYQEAVLAAIGLSVVWE